jgi:urease subunit beta
MNLRPREKEKLLVAVAAMVAQRRANRALQFDRLQARGFCSTSSAGIATRFERGRSRLVRLAAYADPRRAIGFNGRVNGVL